MSDLTKEEKEFLNTLTKRAAYPDPAFKKALKAEVYKEYYNKPSILPRLSFYFGSLAVLSLALIFLSNSLLIGTNPTIETINTNFSTEEKENVYANILKNNPVKVVQSTVKAEIPQNDLNKQESDAEIMTVQQKYTQDYYLAEFSTFTQTYSKQCSAVDVQDGTTYFTEYRDKDRYYSKIVTRNLNNQIVDYNLSKIKGDKVEEYVLNGKNSVIKSNSTIKTQASAEVVVSSPVSYIANQAEQESMFEDTVLDQKIKKNGKEYYVLKTQRLADCEVVTSFPVSYGVKKSTLITLSYFNAQTFALELTESYLNQTTSSNILYTQTFLKREKQIELDKIEREFEYDLTAKVVEQIKVPVSYAN